MKGRQTSTIYAGAWIENDPVAKIREWKKLELKEDTLFNPLEGRE